MSSKSGTLINNTLIFMVGSIGSKFIQFFLVPLYTYTLTTEEFGITELVLTAANLLMPLFSVSIADGLLRFGLDKNLSKQQVMKCALVIVGIGSLASLMLSPFFMMEKTLGQWLIYFLLILNLRIYRDIFAIFLKINDKNKHFAVDSILYTLELCGLSILFLVPLKMGIEGYFLAHALANLGSIVYLLFAGHPLKGIAGTKTDTKLLKEILIYSVPMIVNGLSWWVANAANRFMLSYYMTESDVGIYSVAAKIPLFIGTFTGVFCQAWIISAVIEFENEQERKFYSVTFHRYAFFLFFAASGLIAIIRPFMHFYVAPEFEIAWQSTPFLIFSTVFTSLAGFMVGVYAAAKKNVSVMITTLLGAIVNIILNAILIPTMGVMGAAFATTIGWALIFVTRIINIKSFFAFYINKRQLLGWIFLLMAQCVGVSYCGNMGYIISAFCFIATCYLGKGQLMEYIIITKAKITRR